MGSKGQMTVTPDLPPEFEDLIGDTSTAIGGFQGRLPLMGNRFSEAETDWGYPEWRDNPRLPGGHGLGRTDPSIVSTDRGPPPVTTDGTGGTDDGTGGTPPVGGLPGKPMPGAGGLTPQTGNDPIAPAKPAGPQSLGLGVGGVGGGGRKVAYIDEQGRPRSQKGYLVNPRGGDQVAPAQRDFSRQEGWADRNTDWWSGQGMEAGGNYGYSPEGGFQTLADKYPGDSRYTDVAGQSPGDYAGPQLSYNAVQEMKARGISVPEWAQLAPRSHTDPRIKFPGYGGRNPDVGGSAGGSSGQRVAKGSGEGLTSYANYQGATNGLDIKPSYEDWQNNVNTNPEYKSWLEGSINQNSDRYGAAAKAMVADDDGGGGAGSRFGGSDFWSGASPVIQQIYDLFYPKQNEEFQQDSDDGTGGGGTGTLPGTGDGGVGDDADFGGTSTFKPVTDTGGNMGMAMNPDPSAGMGFAAPWIRPVAGTAPIFDWAADQIPGMAAPSGYMNAAGAATGAGVDASKRKVLGAGLPQPPRSTFGAGGTAAKSRIAPLPTGTTSPTFEASRRAFEAMTMPMIQQNRTLMGLGRSNAVGKDTADAWAGMLPSLIEGELGREERGINREMGGAFQAANLYGGLEDRLFGRETGATDRGMAAGQIYRGVAEDLNKSIYEDFARRQAMSEKLLYAPFGQAQSAVGSTQQQGGLFK